MEGPLSGRGCLTDAQHRPAQRESELHLQCRALLAPGQRRLAGAVLARLARLLALRLPSDLVSASHP